MNRQILNRLIKLLEEAEGLDDIKEDDTFENLGMGSLEVAHFEVLVEKDFGFTQGDSWANKKDTIKTAAIRFTRIYEQEERRNRPKD
jgi:acyl carrier protein